jgi:hypothetical protein
MQPASINRVDCLYGFAYTDSMATLRIKTSTFEIELVSEDLTTDLGRVPTFLSEISVWLSQRDRSGAAAAERTGPAFSEVSEEKAEDCHPSPDQAALQQGMNSYVAKFNADSARKIIEVAAIHLSLCDGLDSFTKEQIFARARQSREWKADYSNQQSIAINRMVKAGEMTERAGGSYCIPTKSLEAAKKVLFDD